MSRYVLVHGSWHGAWCWEKIVPLLEAQGHTVEAINLPGRGADKTPLAELTLAAYDARVCQALDSQPEPAILVGHSMGGVVITQAAEHRPDKIQALVYLSAFLPQDGQSLLDLAQQDRESQLVQNLVIAEDQGYHWVKDEALRDVFYADCTDEVAAQAIARLVPEPLAPVATPVHVTDENFGRIPRVYITSLRDVAVGPLLQQQMYTTVPCQAVIPMETGHSPFFAASKNLAGHLMSVPELLRRSGAELSAPRASTSQLRG